MNPQKDTTTTRQAPEQCMVDKDNQWTLEGPMRISKTGSLSASIATNMDTWQRNADRRKKNEKPGYISNVIRKDILPETAKESKQ